MEKVISYIGTNRGDGQKKSLDRLRKLLNRLNNPHHDLKYIHITGSNGKGSTAAMFQSVLREADLKVGLFTSPHLEFINERIRINNEFIDDEDLIRLINHMEPAIIKLEAELDEKFYAFELLTVLAFLYFQEKQPDIIVLEAGIGGRLDATNVIEESNLTIITSIGIDHISTLGETKEDILKEKVQILKENGDMVIGPISPDLRKIASEWADKMNGKLRFIQTENIKDVQFTNDFEWFTYKNYEEVKLPFIGSHQIENATLVIEGAEVLSKMGYPIDRETVYRGLEKASWPGRFEKVSENPLFYIDGAHNLASVDRLVETLNQLFPKTKFHFVVGMMKDKDYEKMLEKVYSLAKEFILISPDPNRGFDIKEVAQLIKAEGIEVRPMEHMGELFDYIDQEIEKDDIIIQFGSLYLVGALKEEQAKIQYN